MTRRALTFGALAALAGALWTLLEYALGWHTTRADVGRWTGLVSLAFPVAAVVLAVRAARRARGAGLTFARALGEGAAVTLVFSALGAAFFWAYYARINPGAAGPARSGPAAQAGGAFAASLATGLAISAVVAAVMRRRPGRA